MKVTVVIPTKNEEHNLLEVIERVRPYADEILVVDGHSTDRTREVAEAAGVRVILDNKKGKGAALRHVINFVETEITVFIDADGSHDPEDIPKLTYPLLKGEADMSWHPGSWAAQANCTAGLTNSSAWRAVPSSRL